MANGDFVQVLISSAIAFLLTMCCALLTHLAMKYCGDVASSSSHAMGPEAGMASFGRFCILNLLYCASWAVAWSNWRLVLAVLDSLEQRFPGHDIALAVAVITPVIILSICFYLRFGPEPIIPDPQLQQLCYDHGYSGSIKRSLVSFSVYSCVVFVTMSACDSTYGMFHFLTDKVYSPALAGNSDFDAKLPIVLCLMACTVTIVASFCSAAITRTTEVNELSSMRLSRSAHEARSRMLIRRRWHFEFDGSYKHKDLDGVELQERRFDTSAERLGEVKDHPADDAAGHPHVPHRERAHSGYVRQDNNGVSGAPHQWVSRMSRTLCASVLIYDVLGLVVCVQWGAVAFRSYVVLLGHLAGLHSLLYALSCLAYATAVVAALARFVRTCFPSSEELRHGAPQLEQGQDPFLRVAPDEAEAGAGLPGGVLAPDFVECGSPAPAA